MRLVLALVALSCAGCAHSHSAPGDASAEDVRAPRAEPCDPALLERSELVSPALAAAWVGDDLAVLTIENAGLDPAGTPRFVGEVERVRGDGSHDRTTVDGEVGPVATWRIDHFATSPIDGLARIDVALDGTTRRAPLAGGPCIDVQSAEGALWCTTRSGTSLVARDLDGTSTRVARFSGSQRLHDRGSVAIAHGGIAVFAYDEGAGRGWELSVFDADGVLRSEPQRFDRFLSPPVVGALVATPGGFAVAWADVVASGEMSLELRVEVSFHDTRGQRIGAPVGLDTVTLAPFYFPSIALAAGPDDLVVVAPSFRGDRPIMIAQSVTYDGAVSVPTELEAHWASVIRDGERLALTAMDWFGIDDGLTSFVWRGMCR